MIQSTKIINLKDMVLIVLFVVITRVFVNKVSAFFLKLFEPPNLTKLFGSICIFIGIVY